MAVHAPGPFRWFRRPERLAGKTLPGAGAGFFEDKIGHPTLKERSIADCFADGQKTLRMISALFDGYAEQMLRASSTCLVSFDRNRYSIPASFAGRAVCLRSTAREVRIVADGEVIASHSRRFGRDNPVCDPWHCLPILEKKPGALRNGLPFLAIRPAWNGTCQKPSGRCAITSSGSPGENGCQAKTDARGDRAFVELFYKLLLMAREVGLEVLERACEAAMECGIVNAAVVLNGMRQLTAPAKPPLPGLPDHLRLAIEPMADCQRYDHLRGGQYVH